MPDIRARKGGEPLVCLTAYTTPQARLLDNHADLLLVGDSVAMVLHGHDSTVGIPLDVMILHTRAVMRGAKRACVVIDLPFGSYEESPQAAYRSASRALAETGCSAVKLEGGREMAETIAFLTARGIPVMAHIGLMPQSVRATGGFKTTGREKSEWAGIEADARAVAEAGAFCVVLEGMAEPLAARLTGLIGIPTIGIGASARCDGQILVTDDMLGMADWVPKFVRRYAELGAAIEQAVQAYAADVKARTFPGPEHTYGMRAAKEKPRAGRHAACTAPHGNEDVTGETVRER
ncbi:MAG: 3-methyl-2-oxobutanoate hydroxymethyltransferase [Alphaproteobacteria bacterium]